MITAEELRNVLSYDPETGVFVWLVRSGRCGAGSVAGSIKKRRSSAHVRIHVFGTQYYAHRLAWLYMTGKWPELKIDHVNNDGTDNRFINLRLATSSQNGGNSRKPNTNTSGIKGVRFEDGKWRAQLCVEGMRLHIGLFNCPTAAHIAYCKAAKEYFGEFARLE